MFVYLSWKGIKFFLKTFSVFCFVGFVFFRFCQRRLSVVGKKAKEGTRLLFLTFWSHTFFTHEPFLVEKVLTMSILRFLFVLGISVSCSFYNDLLLASLESNQATSKLDSSIDGNTPFHNNANSKFYRMFSLNLIHRRPRSVFIAMAVDKNWKYLGKDFEFF